ncbi:hypothetical protein J4477_04045 [Candidatus Pacearchaeota archaeon]|nr:hypothetical protein [Candidatus Pacearchaeota archaeon]
MGKKEKIKQAILERPYVFYFIVTFLLYIAINVLINQAYITFNTFFSIYRPSFYIPYILLNLFVAFLVALNISLIIIKFREINSMSGAEGFSILGVIGGLIGGACPGCIAGLLPSILGILGVAGFSLYNLPFHGLEIQILSIVLLIIGALLLSRDLTCKISKKKK